MKRVFQRLNVVKETEDDLKAAKYLEEGYKEITDTSLQETEKPATRRGKGGKKTDETGAGDSSGQSAETESTTKPDGDGA